MSKYYNGKRKGNIFDPKSSEPFKISRSKIDLFIECPRCFYIDRRLGISRPPGYPFTLNNAVDTLLKKEFDLLRATGEPHPLMQQYGIEAVPIKHDKLNIWRNAFKGVQYLHRHTNLIIYGGIDDLWQDTQGNFIVVDYKATSINEEITELNKDWHDSYKRQIEVYQWLLRKNGLPVSDIGYFVYCNGDTNVDKFDGKLNFDITIIPHIGNDGWIDNTITDIHSCLTNNTIPQQGFDCDYCTYRDAVKQYTNE